MFNVSNNKWVWGIPMKIIIMRNQIVFDDVSEEKAFILRPPSNFDTIYHHRLTYE